MGRIDLGKRISLICAATVVAGNLAFADAGKNCITDVKLNRDGGSVKVNIYTNKPYTDSVVVSKKEGNKYVILVPETTSSVRTTPKVAGGGNVSVSMQTINAGKGYTKITIISDKSINVVPKTITSTVPVKTVSKPAQAPVKSAQTVNKPVVKQKTAQQQTRQNNVIKQAQNKTVRKQAQANKVSNVKKQEPVKKVVKSKTQSVAKHNVPQQKTVALKPVVVQKPSKPVQKPTTVNNNINKPMEVLEHEVVSGNVKDVTETKQDALLEQAIKDNDAIIKERKMKHRKKNSVVVDDSKLSAKDCIKLVLEELQELSLWKLLLLAGAITFPIIVIMIILNLDKRINKKISAVRKEDDVEAMERALRENVAAVRAQKVAQSKTVSDPSFNSIDAMLDKVDETPTIADSYSTNPSIEIPNTVNDYEEETTDNVVNDIDTSDFELDNNQNNYVSSTIENETVEPEMVTDSEFEDTLSNDINNEQKYTSTSLDDFISGTNDDLINPSDDNNVADQVSTEMTPYNPDGVLADFSNVNDKEFFDELVLQSFAQKGTDNLPENSPADEVFGLMSGVDSGVMLSDFEQENFENPDNSVDVSNPAVATSSQSDDEVTMLNEVKINDNTGLYLVNYDNFSSLVGHVADDYVVLKKFDGLEKGKIILKHAEKVENANRYLVRVGRNKMIIEVTNKSMSRLIDL